MTPETGSTELWKITLGELDEKMGVKIVEESVDRVVATMPVEGNRQSFGLLHGGASLAVGEAVGSWAAVIHASTLGKTAVGVDVSATHHKSAREGTDHHHGNPHPPGRHADHPRGADHERDRPAALHAADHQPAAGPQGLTLARERLARSPETCGVAVTFRRPGAFRRTRAQGGRPPTPAAPRCRADRPGRPAARGC